MSRANRKQNLKETTTTIFFLAGFKYWEWKILKNIVRGNYNFCIQPLWSYSILLVKPGDHSSVETNVRFYSKQLICLCIFCLDSICRMWQRWSRMQWCSSRRGRRRRKNMTRPATNTITRKNRKTFKWFQFVFNIFSRLKRRSVVPLTLHLLVVFVFGHSKQKLSPSRILGQALGSSCFSRATCVWSSMPILYSNTCLLIITSCVHVIYILKFMTNVSQKQAFGVFTKTWYRIKIQKLIKLSSNFFSSLQSITYIF